MIITPSAKLHQDMEHYKYAIYMSSAGTSDFLELPDFDPANSTFSICVWLRTTWSTNVQGVASHYDNHGEYQWGIVTGSDGTVRFTCGNDNIWQTTLSSSSSVNDGYWHYIVCTYDAGNSRRRIYIDGSLDASDSENRTVGTGTRSVYVGATTYDNSVSAYVLANSSFTGRIESFSFWDKELTSSEVQQYMKFPPTGAITDLMCHLPLNNSDDDVSGNNYDVQTHVGYPSWQTLVDDLTYNHNYGQLSGPSSSGVTGKIGKALSFDGTNDKVWTPPTESLDITGDVTVSCWLKKDTNWDASSSDYYHFAGKGSVYGYGYNLIFYERSTDSSYRLQFVISESGGAEGITGYVTNTFAVNEWTHIAGVFSEGNYIAVYADGKEIGIDNTVYDAPGITSDYFAVAHGADARYTYLDGDIDDVRVYNKALTISDINRVRMGMHPLM